MANQPYPVTRPYNATTLVDWIKRKLGEPVVKVNVEAQQALDRVWEAVQFLTQYHSGFQNRVYIKHQITTADQANRYIDLTAASGTVSVANGSNVIVGLQTDFPSEFTPGVTQITVQGTTANVISVANTTYMTVDTPFGFAANNAQATVVQAEDRIIGVDRILPLSGSAWGVNNPFNVKYQFFLNDIGSLVNFSYSYYVQTMQHLNQLEQMFVGETLVRFTRHQNKLFIDDNWATMLPVGTWIVIEAFAALSPDKYTNIWNDQQLRELATLYLKQQWFQNMDKFSGMPLPGGVSVNVSNKLEAVTEAIEKYHDTVRKEFEEPPQFLIG